MKKSIVFLLASIFLLISGPASAALMGDVQGEFYRNGGSFDYFNSTAPIGDGTEFSYTNKNMALTTDVASMGLDIDGTIYDAITIDHTSTFGVGSSYVFDNWEMHLTFQDNSIDVGSISITGDMGLTYSASDNSLTLSFASGGILSTDSLQAVIAFNGLEQQQDDPPPVVGGGDDGDDDGSGGSENPFDDTPDDTGNAMHNPIPAPILLLGSGLVGLAGFRRRKK